MEDLQFKIDSERQIFKKLFTTILFTLREFSGNLLRGSRRRNILYFHIFVLMSDLGFEPRPHVSQRVYQKSIERKSPSKYSLFSFFVLMADLSFESRPHIQPTRSGSSHIIQYNQGHTSLREFSRNLLRENRRRNFLYFHIFVLMSDLGFEPRPHISQRVLRKSVERRSPSKYSLFSYFRFDVWPGLWIKASRPTN